MTIAAVATMGVAAGLLQLGAVPALFAGDAAPLLPVALIAAWAAVREADETWPLLLVVPVSLGVASQERVGWFMIALIPVAALALAAGRGNGAHRVALAPVVAAAGTLLYLTLLTAAAGHAATLRETLASHLAAALWTAAAAAAMIGILHPLRARTRGLFG
jgi:hypothetical protein